MFEYFTSFTPYEDMFDYLFNFIYLICLQLLLFMRVFNRLEDLGGGLKCFVDKPVLVYVQPVYFSN